LEIIRRNSKCQNFLKKKEIEIKTKEKRKFAKIERKSEKKKEGEIKEIMIKEIVTFPDKFLLFPCVEVEPNLFGTEELKNLIRDMLDTMAYHNAEGIAANQIGECKRIFLLRDGTVVINPKILAKSGKITSRDEGCLSVPNEFVTSKRAKKVVVEGYDINGEKIRLVSKTNLEAIVLQHEIDHLDGKTILGRDK
jgi:peptide deformylase